VTLNPDSKSLIAVVIPETPAPSTVMCMSCNRGMVNHLVGVITIFNDWTSRSTGDTVPKVRRPKKGWFRPSKKKPRRGPLVAPSEKGLPPCPACGEWSMQKDNIRKEIFCGSCGAIA